MNFQNIPPVELSKFLLDFAFKKAREKNLGKKYSYDPLLRTRKKEGIKVDVVKDILVTRLQKILHSFPGTATLPLFYQELIKLTTDYKKLKSSFGAIDWAIKQVKSLQRQYSRKISKAEDPVKMKQASKEVN